MNDEDRTKFNRYMNDVFREQSMRIVEDAFRKELENARASVRQVTVRGEPWQITSTGEVERVYSDAPKQLAAPADPDRPTLAERLDKAEAERDELRLMYDGANDRAEAYQKQIIDMKGFLADREARIDYMAKRLNALDTMMSDLEKCRRAMGDIQFHKVVGVPEGGLCYTGEPERVPEPKAALGKKVYRPGSSTFYHIYP